MIYIFLYIYYISGTGTEPKKTGSFQVLKSGMEPKP